MIDEEYREIEEDMIGEAQKYGKVKSIRIPRPKQFDEFVVGSGSVFIEFDNVNEARQARKVI